tara:strand:+ start:19330 stop:20715 length:1386 start_codon:yes stop_codon:yes gene_type:complete
MIELLSFFFLVIAGLELYLGYKIISKSDPFTALSLLCIRFIFDFFLRPFTFIFVENYEPILSRQVTKGIIHVADAPFYSLLTIILNDIAFFFFLLGAYILIKRKPIPTNQNLKIKNNNRYLILGLGIFLIGLINWYWVMQSSGGILSALLSLGTGRQNLFRVGGSTIPFEIAKHFLSGGIFLLSSYFFLKRRILIAWFLTISLFFLLLTFGGRGLAMAAIISGLIAHNYLFNKIKLRTLLVLFLVSLPLLVFLKDARRLLDGQTELQDIDLTVIFDSKGDDFKNTMIDLSYVSHAYDYDMAFHYSYFVRDKDFFLGEYPLGIGMILPRSLFPNKGETLANKLSEELWCDGIGCTIDVGISPSLVTASASYWGYISFPFICFFAGYFAMYFWYQMTVRHLSPLSLMIYAMGYPYTVTLFLDLNAFLASTVPIALLALIIYLLFYFPVRQTFYLPEIKRHKRV